MLILSPNNQTAQQFSSSLCTVIIFCVNLKFSRDAKCFKIFKIDNSMNITLCKANGDKVWYMCLIPICQSLL